MFLILAAFFASLLTVVACAGAPVGYEAKQGFCFGVRPRRRASVRV